MNERQMNLTLMIVCIVTAIICSLGAVGMVLAIVTDGFLLIIPALLLAAGAVGSGYGATIFGRSLSGTTRAFTETESAVLSPKQRRTLRNARADVLLQKALVEVENERDKMISKQLEASRDPDAIRPEPLDKDPDWTHRRRTGGAVPGAEDWH